ncbi:MAG: non-reducing end alpha-L-arabinofuranosidase family hydrolase [Planctomycetota bacterium]
MKLSIAIGILAAAAWVAPATTRVSVAPPERFLSTDVLLDARTFGEPDWIAIKDPSIVFHDGRWHMFNTLRGHERSHAMTYTSFETFEQMGEQKPVVLENHDGYWAAPQVFFFEPHGKWYMVSQGSKPAWEPDAMHAVFCTNDDVSDPTGWTSPEKMDVARPPGDNPVPFIDFWVICDDETAYIFFTTDNGKMWRSETSIEAFPFGWGETVLALESDLFEASHIYRLPEADVYVNLVEREAGGGRRAFDLYVADELDGAWRPWSDDGEKLYALPEVNVDFPGEPWTISVSHGELVRRGVDQRMEADLDAPFVYQGIAREDMRGVGYGKIPWKLGLLRPAE